ncbi:CBS domain-containing protein [Streptomyces sp. NPDC048392]|uniref:CBS domain-containing protein n=1 Tax=Streptomyces sp. NPDC048392 TaxID=3365543 RepID=UPI0037244C47
MAEYVKDVMTAGVAAVRPGSSLVEAARLMRTQHIRDVVVADGQEVVGMLTDRDIAVRAVAEGLDPMAVSVRTVCSRNPLLVSPNDPVADVEALMREHAVYRLPVVEDGLPVGTVGLGDLAAPGSAAPDTRTGAEPDRTAPHHGRTAHGR